MKNGQNLFLSLDQLHIPPGRDYINRQVMRSWFANAIEAGYLKGIKDAKVST